MPKNQPAPFGTYPPPKLTTFYKLLTQLRLSRGAINRKISKHCKSQICDGQLVDIEKYGLKFRLSILNNATDSKILTSSKVYEAAELNFLSQALSRQGNDPVFIDIGANTGYYSLMLAKRGFQKILAVEPNPQTVALLEDNIRINESESIIIPVPSAIGEGETVQLFVTDSLGSATLVSNFSEEHQEATAINVQTMSIHELLKREKLEKIDALKIDVEGYEDRALVPFFQNTPKKAWPKFLVLEHSHREFWETDLIDFLKNRGYNVHSQVGGNTLLNKS